MTFDHPVITYVAVSHNGLEHIKLWKSIIKLRLAKLLVAGPSINRTGELLLLSTS
jgi:hypothetical protein